MPYDNLCILPIRIMCFLCMPGTRPKDGIGPLEAESSDSCDLLSWAAGALHCWTFSPHTNVHIWGWPHIWFSWSWYYAVLCIEIAYTESVLPKELAYSGGWRSAIFSDYTGCRAGFRLITFAFYFLQEIVYFLLKNYTWHMCIWWGCSLSHWPSGTFMDTYA